MSNLDMSRELQRGGVRGGKDQFSWDSLKNKPHRERAQYLGYSEKLGTAGRFGAYDRNDWWRTGSSGSTTIEIAQAERNAVKMMEERVMNEALGIRPKITPLASSSDMKPDDIIKREYSTLISNAADARGMAKAHDEFDAPMRQVSGLGFRKYLKPTDWTDIQDVDDILEGDSGNVASGTIVKEEPADLTGPKRVFGPARPPPTRIKEEVAPDEPDKPRYRSRSRDRR